VLPDNPVTLYSAANINTLGIGVYDSQSGNEFDFRGIYSGNSSIVVALDAGNNAISITLNIDQIIDDLPQATTTQRGVGETATDAEAIAKASITTFLTPSNLAALGSSSTFAGLVELATDAETQAGISTTLAVTPAGLASVIALQQGTETWADAVARAAADPDFAGQVGVQLDTDVMYISTGAAVGDFDMPVFMLGNMLNQLPANTTIDLNNFTISFSGPSSFIITSADFAHDGGIASFDNGSARFGSTASLDFDFGMNCRVFAGNVIIPASSVLITTGTAGEVDSTLISTFLSLTNTQTGYTAFANGAILRTCDTATVTLPQLAQIVGTLIEDLKAVQLPAT
jgi:hypothetical protein